MRMSSSVQGHWTLPSWSSFRLLCASTSAPALSLTISRYRHLRVTQTTNNARSVQLRGHLGAPRRYLSTRPTKRRLTPSDAGCTSSIACIRTPRLCFTAEVASTATGTAVKTRLLVQWLLGQTRSYQASYNHRRGKQVDADTLTMPTDSTIGVARLRPEAC